MVLRQKDDMMEVTIDMKVEEVVEEAEEVEEVAEVVEEVEIGIKD